MTNPKTEPLKDDEYVRVSYYRMRKVIGLLGMGLPFALAFGVLILVGHPFVQSSISQYCFTVMGDFFVLTLAMIAIYLITYRGPSDVLQKQDNWITNLAGGLLICVALFPTPGALENDNKNLILHPKEYFDKFEQPFDIHNYSAFLFFLLIAYMSFRLFPRGITKNDILARRVQYWTYKVCGVVMFICAIILLIIVMNGKNSSGQVDVWLGINRPVFWFELIAVEAFGLSWFIKGLDYQTE